MTSAKNRLMTLMPTMMSTIVKEMIQFNRLEMANKERVRLKITTRLLVYTLFTLNRFIVDAAGNASRQKGGHNNVPKLTLGKIKVGIMDSYKSRSARPAFYNQNILLATESADMTTKQGHILLHKNL